MGNTLRKRSNLLEKGAGPVQQDGVKRTQPSVSISRPLDTQTFSSWKPGTSPGAIARGDVTESSPPSQEPSKCWEQNGNRVEETC